MSNTNTSSGSIKQLILFALSETALKVSGMKVAGMPMHID